MERQITTKASRGNSTPAAKQSRSMRAPAHPILGLQQTIGNQAVQRLLQSPQFQAKFQVSQPGDKYEQEADRVADTVMRMPEPMLPEEEKTPVQMKPLAAQISPLVQRASEPVPEEKKEEVVAAKPLLQRVPVAVREDDEEKVQTKPLLSADSTVQRLCTECEEETVQTKEQADQTPALAPQAESQISNLQSSGGEPLAEPVRAYFEPRFGQDFSQVRVHQGSQAAASARAVNARAYTTGRNIAFGAGEYAPETTEGKRLLAHELTHVVQQGGASLAGDTGTSAATSQLKVVGTPIQTRAAQGVIQRNEKEKNATFVPYQIHVKQPMTQEEFRIAAMRQVFGAVLKYVDWENSKDTYVPEKSPYTLRVDTKLLKQQRGQASKDRGISVGADGGVTGAEERAKTFHAGSDSDQKTALMKEINHRYYEAVGDKTETKIKAGEKGKAELWRTIRDEVLFQHEYIANLPPKVKELIKLSTKGKELTPADYDKLFAIAKKIEKMPAGQVSDYASKVTGTTTDLNQFEASLESYSTEMAKRQKGTEAHKDTMTKLAGLEQVYEKYKTWVRKEAIAPGANQTEQAELEKLLKAHDFAGIPEFKQYIDKFLNGFETESAGVIQDLLAKYDGRLYREGERYKNPQEVSALHGKLGGYRSNLDVMKQSEDVMQAEYAKQRDARERSGLPSHGGTTPEPTEAFKAAQKKGKGAREAAKSELGNLAPEHPIFQDDEALPVDRRINKIALHTATETSLQGVLLGFIAQRKDAVKDARGELAGNSELIWEMDKMIPQFMLQQGIVDGSIHAQIIQDKMRADRIKKIVIGILAAIAAIALTVVSLGTATPAIVAAGAAAGAFGISAYMAYEDVKSYVQEKKLADVGLVDDPSIIWVVIAIAGAALDAGAAVKAIRAIAPAAKVLNATGDVAKFNKVVRALEQVGEIDAKIARAAERAAAAKASFKEASTDLVQVLGSRAYAFPGPFADPDVYKQLVKMAAAKFKEVGNNGLIFIEEIKKARALAKLGDMTPEELAKVKQAWEEAKVLEAAEIETWKNIQAISWKGFSKGKLAEHYGKHGAEFAGLSQPQYLKAAKDFAAEAGGFQMEQVGNFLVKFDPATKRTLIAHIADREIRTFYKADLRDADAFQAAVNLAKQISSP